MFFVSRQHHSHLSHNTYNLSSLQTLNLSLRFFDFEVALVGDILVIIATNLCSKLNIDLCKEDHEPVPQFSEKMTYLHNALTMNKKTI